MFDWEIVLFFVEFCFEIMVDFILFDIVYFMIIVFCFECCDIVIKYMLI